MKTKHKRLLKLAITATILLLIPRSSSEQKNHKKEQHQRKDNP